MERRLLLSATLAGAANPVASKQELPVLVLIDVALPDQQLLAQSLPNAVKIYFNPATDSAASILQRTISIAKNLGGNFQSVVILTHGASGEFELGDNIISNQTLNATAADWKAPARKSPPAARSNYSHAIPLPVPWARNCSARFTR